MSRRQKEQGLCGIEQDDLEQAQHGFDQEVSRASTTSPTGKAVKSIHGDTFGNIGYSLTACTCASCRVGSGTKRWHVQVFAAMQGHLRLLHGRAA